MQRSSTQGKHNSAQVRLGWNSPLRCAPLRAGPQQGRQRSSAVQHCPQLGSRVRYGTVGTSTHRSAIFHRSSASWPANTVRYTYGQLNRAPRTSHPVFERATSPLEKCKSRSVSLCLARLRGFGCAAQHFCFLDDDDDGGGCVVLMMPSPSERAAMNVKVSPYPFFF